MERSRCRFPAGKTSSGCVRWREAGSFRFEANPNPKVGSWEFYCEAEAARDGFEAYGFNASALTMSVIAFCARTLLPASSRGGETTARPN